MRIKSRSRPYLGLIPFRQVSLDSQGGGDMNLEWGDTAFTRACGSTASLRSLQGQAGSEL